MKKPLVVLAGPTAVGKTELSISLAKRINGEIISADSMQVYKYMDIGSAKIKYEEMQGIKHHLIDVLDPTEEFNVSLFQSLVKKSMVEIYEQGRIPILVGGTGFYIQAILYDIDFTKESSEKNTRKALTDFLHERGADALFERLKEVDPKSAEAIHPNNTKRVIRALEYFYDTGELISVHNERERKKESPYNFVYFVLNDKRDLLYQRIDRRVDLMMEQDLVSEVESLKKMGCNSEMTSMQGLGYKEILSYLNGENSLTEAVDKIKRNTRRFAKRQLTWFRREPDVIWVDKDKFGYDEEKILAFMLEKLEDAACR